MKILITGVNGFIGSNIVNEIIKEHYVIGTDIASETKINVNEYFSWDIGNQKIPDEAILDKIEVIVHVAACLEKNALNEQLIAVNCMGTHRIYQLVKKRNVKKVVYISGIPVIGIPKNLPITEEHELVPSTMYHVTKLSGEFILNQLREDGIKVVNLRLPSPIGIGMNMKTILPVFLSKALRDMPIELMGKGTRRQNYIDVRDVAALVRVILKNSFIDGTYNWGSEITISNYELAQLCIDMCNSKSQIIFSGEKDFTDSYVWDIDITKLKNLTGYKNEYSIEMTIKDIIRDMKG